MRRASLLLCMLIVPVALAKAPSPVHFLDRTNVVFPESIGIYRVGRHDQDPQMVSAGVSIAYDIDGGPVGTTVTAYVYPHGRSSEVDALERGLNDIRVGVNSQPAYSEIRIDPDTPFAVPAPSAPLLADGKRGRQKSIMLGSPAGSSPAAGGDGIMSDVLAELTTPTTTAGRRVLMRLRTGSTLERSVGYVSYRHLMLVKLRISSPVNSADEQNFLAMADAAAAAIMPSFEIQNFGTCGHLVIPEGGTDEASAQAGGVALIREMARVRRENCATTEGKPDRLAKARIRHTIVYPEGTWK